MKSIEFLNAEFIKIKIGKEFDTGSITPTTTSKKFILDEVKISKEALEAYQSYQEDTNKKLDENCNKLKDELSLKEKEINFLKELVVINGATYKDLLDGAIKKSEPIISQIKKLEISSKVQTVEFQDFGFETIYQENIKDANSVNTVTPVVLRYGLDTDSAALKSIVGAVIEKGVLHPYEKAIFQNALKYLKIVGSAEEYMKNKPNYPNNVVLVDIFDRSSGFVKEGHNQTHTVVLWKKKDDEIVLIDPSQKSYSDHLLEQENKISDILIKALDCKTLYGVAIYKNNDTVGYSEYNDKNPKPRDCVDIAVKIGFELNEQQKKLTVLEDVSKEMLKQISNDLKHSIYLTKLLGVVVRELQSSDFKTRVNSKESVTIVNEYIQKIQGLQINKIKNYQDISRIKEAVLIIKDFC